MGRKRTAKQPVADTETTTLPASHPSDTSRISFLDLPAEMRNETYSYALTASKPLRVIPKSRSAPKLNGQEHLPYGAQKKHYSTAINILRTCRQINYEASPIFYGTNAFIARWEDALFPFTRANFRHDEQLKLTVLHLQAWISPLVTKLNKWIRQPQPLQLRSLRISSTGLSSEFDPISFAKKLVPFVRATVKTGRDPQEVIEMIEFFPGDGANYEGGPEAKFRAPLYTKMVRKELAKIAAKGIKEARKRKAGKHSLYTIQPLAWSWGI